MIKESRDLWNVLCYISSEMGISLENIPQYSSNHNKFWT